MDCVSFGKTVSKNRTQTAVAFWWWNQATLKNMMKYIGAERGCKKKKTEKERRHWDRKRIIDLYEVIVITISNFTVMGHNGGLVNH